MKRRLKIALAYLLLLALSGCAIQPGDKTVAAVIEELKNSINVYYSSK